MLVYTLCKVFMLDLYFKVQSS